MLIGEKRKGIVSLLLVLSLVAFSWNLMAQDLSRSVRKGAKLRIQKNDGQQVTGELITVKKDSLLLMSAEINADISSQILIKEVEMITIVTKSRVLQVGIYGVLAGILYGSATKSQSRSFEPNQKYITFGAIGGVAGAVLGTVLGINKKIQIQGKSDAEIQKTLEKLSKSALVPGIQ